MGKTDASSGQTSRRVLSCYAGVVVAFLIFPSLVIVPLSFNTEPYFTFTPGMLALDANAFSLRWYKLLVTSGMLEPSQPPWTWSYLVDAWQNGLWINATRNSLFIATAATALATTVGTLAALGLTKSVPGRKIVVGLAVAPLVVPIVITAAGSYLFYSSIGMTGTYFAIIVAHAVLGVPFVIMTVSASLSNFDTNLIRAGASLGATPFTVARKVTIPIIAPGVVSGAIFAFVTSFDEVVIVIFLADFDQRTLPRQMWSGIREQISPTILAAATILAIMSLVALLLAEKFRSRSERIRTTGVFG